MMNKTEPAKAKPAPKNESTKAVAQKPAAKTPVVQKVEKIEINDEAKDQNAAYNLL
jgi:hypothetical protein